jgi:hypothetical protein
MSLLTGGATGRRFIEGNGTPEGAVTGSRGDIYSRKDGGTGTTFYVKETGDATNTGWTPTNPSGSIGGGGTSGYLPLFTPDGTHIGDSFMQQSGPSTVNWFVPTINVFSTGGMHLFLTSGGATDDAQLIFGVGGNQTVAGKERSAGGAIFSGSAPYAAVFGNFANHPVQFFVNNTLVGEFTLAGFSSVANLVVGTVGYGINIKEGANARAGVATLVAGTILVNTTAVSATSRVLLSRQALNASTALGELTFTKVNGTSITITAVDVATLLTQALDVSDIYWEIREPA